MFILHAFNGAMVVFGPARVPVVMALSAARIPDYNAQLPFMPLHGERRTRNVISNNRLTPLTDRSISECLI